MSLSIPLWSEDDDSLMKLLQANLLPQLVSEVGIERVKILEVFVCKGLFQKLKKVLVSLAQVKDDHSFARSLPLLH